MTSNRDPWPSGLSRGCILMLVHLSLVCSLFPLNGSTTSSFLFLAMVLRLDFPLETHTDFALFTELVQAVDLISWTANSCPHQKERELLLDVTNVGHTCCSPSYSLRLCKSSLAKYCFFLSGLGASFRVLSTAFSAANTDSIKDSTETGIVCPN